jgi:hypothetical protein
MANQNLLTYGAKIASVEQTYYSPVTVVPPNYNIFLGTTYCFISKVNPWTDEENPPVPTQDQQAIKTIFKNMFVAKKINVVDISPVIQRIDWTEGETYFAYSDTVDLFEQDVDGNLVNRFYVKNKYDQVFKCLWNNNGGVSLNEPYFEPGFYGTNNIYTGQDGYKWKYMYTIDTGSRLKFMDNKWMPIPVGANTPNPTITSAGAGDIEVINVVQGGSGYDAVNTNIIVTITGDGTGAVGYATVNTQANGAISDIYVTNAGTNYTYSSVSISAPLGSNAIVIGPTSPVGGHGYDPVSELGSSRVMLVSKFNGSEGGLIPTDIDYRQIGLLINPSDSLSNPYPANNSIYKLSTDIVVVSGFGSYQPDEKVYQGNIDSPSFSATVLSFDAANNVVKTINTIGTPSTSTALYGQTSLTTRTVLSYSVPDFIIFSGYLSYVENRKSIQRSPDGIEQFKFVLGY